MLFPVCCGQNVLRIGSFPSAQNIGKGNWQFELKFGKNCFELMELQISIINIAKSGCIGDIQRHKN